MKHLTLITLLAGLIIALLPHPVRAQSPDDDGPPSRFWLDGLQIYYQMNPAGNSAAALAIQLSYFDYPGSQTYIREGLSTSQTDPGARLEELVAFVESQGGMAVARYGGTTEQVKRLIAGGFPVLVENAAYYGGTDTEADWYKHMRVLVGYDPWNLYAYDPVLGDGADDRGHKIPLFEFDSRWRPFQRSFMVIYNEADQETVADLMGYQMDAEASARGMLAQAEVDDGFYNDFFVHYNTGVAYTHLGEYAEAIAHFEQAFRQTPPDRFLWYRFEVFEAYLQMEQYETVIRLVNRVLNDTRDVEEMYYYIGRAYEGQGNSERARANYSAALYRNGNFTAAREALEASGGTSP